MSAHIALVSYDIHDLDDESERDDFDEVLGAFGFINVQPVTTTAKVTFESGFFDEGALVDEEAPSIEQIKQMARSRGPTWYIRSVFETVANATLSGDYRLEVAGVVSPGFAKDRDLNFAYEP